MVSGSGFGASRLPQNLGMGQKECLDRNILGFSASYGRVEKMKDKLGSKSRRVKITICVQFHRQRDHSPGSSGIQGVAPPSTLIYHGEGVSLILTQRALSMVLKLAPPARMNRW
jgi:hypothetical protein